MEALSGVGEPCDIVDSSDEMDAQEESIHERTVSRKKKSKRHKGIGLVRFWFSPVCHDHLKLLAFSVAQEVKPVENQGLDLSSGTGLIY